MDKQGEQLGHSIASDAPALDDFPMVPLRPERKAPAEATEDREGQGRTGYRDDFHFLLLLPSRVSARSSQALPRCRSVSLIGPWPSDHR